MNKCDNCVKDIDTCNVCTYNLEKTYKKQTSDIGEYSIRAEYEESWFYPEDYPLYRDKDYDEYW